MDKDAYYFPHFCNARNDRKLRRVRKELGVEGYGIYFMILEVLREQKDFRYPMDDIDLMADEFRTSDQKVRVVICNYDLFKVDDNSFYSESLAYNCRNKRKNHGRCRLSERNYPLWRKRSYTVFLRDNFTCHYCEKVGGKLEADHVVPFSKGGSDAIHNLVCSCRTCNRRKKNKPYKEFINE